MNATHTGGKGGGGLNRPRSQRMVVNATLLRGGSGMNVTYPGGEVRVNAKYPKDEAGDDSLQH